MDLRTLSNYHKAIILLYIIITPIIFLFLPFEVSYSPHKFLTSTAIIAASLAVLTLFITLKCRVNLKPSFFTALIALIFSFSEEIIFRGIIQTILETYFSSTVIIIFFSSLVFGLAHLPNKAESIHPKGWNWSLSGAAFLGGIPLGTLFSLTDSLLFPTLLHFLFLAVLSGTDFKNI